MKSLYLIFLFFITIALSGCGNKEKNETQTSKTAAPQTKTLKQKPVSTSVKLHAVNGEDIVFTKEKNALRLKNNSGKIILLNFFATWCPPCKAEIPHLINLQDKYKDKFKIISVLLEDDKPDSEIKSFIDYNHINYIVTNDINNFKLSNLLGGIQSIPFMILYDKNGKVITHYIGIIPEEMIDSDIKKAIKQ